MESIVTLIGMLVSLSLTDATQLKENYQVLQRDARDMAACVIALPQEWQSDGSLRVKVINGDDTVIYQKVFRSQDSQCENPDGLLLKQVPTGGPYRIHLQMMDAQGKAIGEKDLNNILVGDLWILAGQSNMEGVPPARESLQPLPTINMLNLDNHWLAAKPPVHRMYEAEAPAFVNQQKMHLTEEQILKNRKTSRTVNPLGGTGPGFFFARELVAESSVPVGLIPCAYGGSSLAGWDPAGLIKGDETLYGFMIERVRLAGGRVRGMLWYQGESDAGPGQVENPIYKDKLREFFTAVRRDCQDPELPIIMAQIATFIGYEGRYADKGTLDRPYEIIREMQRQLSDEMENIEMAVTVDLSHFDIIHLSYEAQKRLGHRFAYLALPYVAESVTPRTGIQLVGAKYAENSQRRNVVVEFTGMTGRIHAPGRPHGFEFRQRPEGEPMDWVYQIDFDPENPGRMTLKCDVGLPEGTALYYAPRANSYVNLIDENDMAVPAFGPVVIE